MKSDQKEYALYSSTHIDPENANCQQLWKSDEPVLGEDWWQGGMRRSFRGAQKTLRGGYVHYLDCGIVLKSVKAHMSYICQNCTLQIFIPSLT